MYCGDSVSYIVSARGLLDISKDLCSTSIWSLIFHVDMKAAQLTYIRGSVSPTV